MHRRPRNRPLRDARSKGGSYSFQGPARHSAAAPAARRLGPQERARVNGPAAMQPLLFVAPSAINSFIFTAGSFPLQNLPGRLSARPLGGKCRANRAQPPREALTQPLSLSISRQSSALPRRLKVRLRTLTPSIEVRILTGHPDDIPNNLELMRQRNGRCRSVRVALLARFSAFLLSSWLLRVHGGAPSTRRASFRATAGAWRSGWGSGLAPVRLTL